MKWKWKLLILKSAYAWIASNYHTKFLIVIYSLKNNGNGDTSILTFENVIGKLLIEPSPNIEQINS